jgi:hypothetical protein
VKPEQPFARRPVGSALRSWRHDGSIRESALPAQGASCFYKRFYPGGQEQSGQSRKGIEQIIEEFRTGSDLTGGYLPLDCERPRQIAASPEFRACRLRFCRRSGRPLLNGPPAGNRTSAVILELLQRACSCARRSPRLKRIPRFAALAFPVPQDAADDPRIRDERDNAHAGATAANEGINLEDFAKQARPHTAAFPGGIGIVLVGVSLCR